VSATRMAASSASWWTAPKWHCVRAKSWCFQSDNCKVWAASSLVASPNSTVRRCY